MEKRLTFDADKLSPELRKAVEDGMADAQQSFAGLVERVNTGEVTSGDAYGTREHLKNKYLNRMAGANNVGFFPGTWDVLRLSLRRQINPQCLAQDSPLNSEIIPGNMRTICGAGAFPSVGGGWLGWACDQRRDNVKFCPQV